MNMEKTGILKPGEESFRKNEQREKRLLQRISRDLAGRRFIDWADAYFEDRENPRLNRRILRSDMEKSYKEELTQQELQYFTPQFFRSKLQDFCRWKGYRLNPQKYHPETGEPYRLFRNGIPDIFDKTHGHEYFTVGDNKGAPFDILAKEPEEEIPELPFSVTKKPDKIIVCLAQSEEERYRMIAGKLVKYGFARTPHEARKIIACSPFDIDLSGAYFVAALTCDFSKSADTTHRLYSMAIRGNLVLTGAKRIPPEMEFMCEIYMAADLH